MLSTTHVPRKRRKLNEIKVGLTAPLQFTTLPRPILERILTWSGADDWPQLIVVCKSVYATLVSGIGHLTAVELDRVPPGALALAARHCQRLRHVSCSNTVASSILISRNQATLTSVVVGHWCCKDIVNHCSVIAQCKKLEQLTVKTALPYLDRDVWIKFIQQLPALESVTVDDESDIPRGMETVTATTCAAMQLPPLSLIADCSNRFDLMALLSLPRERFTRIRALSLTANDMETKRRFLHVPSLEFPLLSHLTLSTAEDATEHLFISGTVAWSLPMLETLDLHCVVFSIPLDAPRLRAAKLYWAKPSGRRTLAHLTQSKQLQELRICALEECDTTMESLKIYFNYWPDLRIIDIDPTICLHPYILKAVARMKKLETAKLGSFNLRKRLAMMEIFESGLTAMCQGCPLLETLVIDRHEPGGDEDEDDDDEDDGGETKELAIDSRPAIVLDRLATLEIGLPFPAELLSRLRTPHLETCSLDVSKLPSGALAPWLMATSGHHHLDRLELSNVRGHALSGVKYAMIGNEPLDLVVEFTDAKHVNNDLIAFMCATPQTATACITFRDTTRRDKSSMVNLCHTLMHAAFTAKAWPNLTQLHINGTVDIGDVMAAVYGWPKLASLRIGDMDMGMDATSKMALAMVSKSTSSKGHCKVLLPGPTMYGPLETFLVPRVADADLENSKT